MTTPAKKGRGKGRTSKQLRYLFAARILTGSGKGKNRSVSYNPKRARNIQALRKRGVNTTRKYRNTPTGSNRPVIGGSKAAGLRSGAAARASTRADRIAAGRTRAQTFLASDRGQKITRGIDNVRKPRRTGRADKNFPARERSGKADLKAAGVKVKTGKALSERNLPRLRGDYSGPQRSPVKAPLLRQREAQAAARTARADQRAKYAAITKGKTREQRIEIGKLVASPYAAKAQVKLAQKFEAKRAKGQVPTLKERNATRDQRVMLGKLQLGKYNRQQGEKQARAAAQAAREKAAATTRRLRGRETRLALQVAKKEKQRTQRLTARTRRAGKVEALDRSRRIKAGQSVLAAFRARRDAQYNAPLF